MLLLETTQEIEMDYGAKLCKGLVVYTNEALDDPRYAQRCALSEEALDRNVRGNTELRFLITSALHFQEMMGHRLVDSVDGYVDAFEKGLIDSDEELTLATIIGPPRLEPIIQAIGLLAAEEAERLEGTEFDHLVGRVAIAQAYYEEINAASVATN